jgi:hypothetical protein
VPPSPNRQSRSSTSNTPPASGLITIAERSSTVRVFGRASSVAAASHCFATSIENRHVSGAPGSSPPSTPFASSLAAASGPPVWCA